MLPPELLLSPLLFKEPPEVPNGIGVMVIEEGTFVPELANGMISIPGRLSKPILFRTELDNELVDFPTPIGVMLTEDV